MSRSFIDCKLFSILTSASHGPSAIAELLVVLSMSVFMSLDVIQTKQHIAVLLLFLTFKNVG